MTEAVCERTGKIAFRTPEAAKRMARWLRRKLSQRQHAYRCAHCRRWHLGHADGEKKA